MNKIITLIALLLLMAGSCDDCPESPEFIFVQSCDDISDMPDLESDDERLVRITSVVPNPFEGTQEMVLRNFSTDTFVIFTLSLLEAGSRDYNEGLAKVSETIDSSSVLNPCDSIRLTVDNFKFDTLGSTYELYFQNQIFGEMGVIQVFQYQNATKGEEKYF